MFSGEKKLNTEMNQTTGSDCKRYNSEPTQAYFLSEHSMAQEQTV